MKKVLFILSLFLFFQLSAQQKLTAEQWKEDILFLKKIINDDYPFLFKKVTAKEFNEAADKLYNQVEDLEDHEIIVGMSRLISLFKYGHTYISFHQKPYEFSQFPFNLYEFNDGVYIEGTHKNYPNAVGTKVIAVEGKAYCRSIKTDRTYS